MKKYQMPNVTWLKINNLQTIMAESGQIEPTPDPYKQAPKVQHGL